MQAPDALLVTSSFLPGRGGIESYLAELCSELSPRLGVLAPASRDSAPLPEDLGYPTRGYEGSMQVPHRGVAGAIIAAAGAFGTDRVLFGTPWPLLLLAPRLRRAGLRYGVIVHGAELLVPAAVPILHRRLARALAGADIILPVSRFTAGKVRSMLSSAGFDAPPIDLLRARVDLDRFHPGAVSDLPTRLGIAGRPIVLVLGRLVRRKGIDRLIEAMPEVARRVPGAMLVVAGTGPQGDSLRRGAARAGAPVSFVGAVQHDAAPGLYASATVFAMPAADRWFGLDAEGLGVVLLEAGACATPCVTGRSGGTPEAVVDGLTGFVVDGRDRATLVDRVVALLTDPGLREDMGGAARDHVRTEFSERRLPATMIDWLSRDS